VEGLSRLVRQVVESIDAGPDDVSADAIARQVAARFNARAAAQPVR